MDNKCRICRREGIKLFLKGERCLSPKCPLDRKGAVPPGVHGPQKTRKRLSDQGRQLREKQKMKRLYEVSERQFRIYFEKAKKQKGQTVEALVKFLESRLDNVVYRLGFVSSRKTARQIIVHGHIQVNNQKVDIPSYQAGEGETISLTTRGLKIQQVQESLKKEASLPSWLERKAAVGRVKRLPTREEVDLAVNDQAVIEYYSR